MLYVKSPLRLTLGGGGTDLPWWYKKNGGYVISASINKYIHVMGNRRTFDDKIFLSYSKTEVLKTDTERYFKGSGYSLESIIIQLICCPYENSFYPTRVNHA